MKLRYLVTGGAGFIGSNIVERLVLNGESVRVFDNFTTGREENLQSFADKIEIVRGDLRNDADVIAAVKGIDVVIHQAALRSVPRSLDDPMSTNDVNVGGTLRLLVQAKSAGVKRVVYASSSSAYGDSAEVPQQELHRPSPISPYAVSKLAAEQYCVVYAKTFGLETVSLRYFNVFGPRQNPESKYSAVIPMFIDAAMTGKTIEIHGDGDQSRDFTFIDNVVNANLLAATVPGVGGHVFNVACNESNSVNDIVTIVRRELAVDVNVIHSPARNGDVRKTCANITKAQQLLGYAPVIRFEEGLKKTIAWFKNRKG